MKCYIALVGFGRKRTPRRVCLSVDLRKAFDSLKWDAILEALRAMGFSTDFRNLIRNYIVTASFSVIVEGSPSRPFDNSKGTQAGRPHLTHPL